MNESAKAIAGALLVVVAIGCKDRPRQGPCAPYRQVLLDKVQSNMISDVVDLSQFDGEEITLLAFSEEHSVVTVEVEYREAHPHREGLGEWNRVTLGVNPCRKDAPAEKCSPVRAGVRPRGEIRVKTMNYAAGIITVELESRLCWKKAIVAKVGREKLIGFAALLFALVGWIFFDWIHRHGWDVLTWDDWEGGEDCQPSSLEPR